MSKVDPNKLPQCAVRGLVAPHAMCACVVAGGRCGTKGPCEHKIEAKPAVTDTIKAQAPKGGD